MSNLIFVYNLIYFQLCAAKKTKVKPDDGNPNYYLLCTNSPALNKRKFCTLHEQNKEDSTSPQADLSLSTRKLAMSLRNRNIIPDPLDDQDGIGCRKSDNIKRYYDTTSGIIGLFRPCGIIIGIYEMYTKVDNETFLVV